MKDALTVVPHDKPVKTGVTDPAAVAEGLAKVLADTYRLTFKTHAYHWNVEGPFFHSIHILTEGQYEDLFAAADVLAERMRALGQLAPTSMAEIIKLSAVEDPKSVPSAQKMIEDLAKDHQSVARRLHDLIKTAEDNNDAVTADLATKRAAFHEKAAWMLSAIVSQ